MQTSVVQASAQTIAQAAQLLLQDEVVGLPTETVYGLAGSALSDVAVGKIFAAKGRPQDNPLISHIADMKMLPMVASEISENAKKLAKAFWPGPLTMVLPKSAQVAKAVCAGLDTAAVRMPSHPVALAVIRAAGVPLAAPSANLSGSPSPTTAEAVYEDLQGRIPLIIDGGVCEIGVESTVVSLAGATPVLLRPGMITKEQLEAALGCAVTLSEAIKQPLKAEEVAASPGMKYKHYAPKAKVILVKGTLAAFCAYVQEQAQANTFALCFVGEEAAVEVPCVTYGGENAPMEQARHLFSALRLLDAKGAQTVYARCPDDSGVGLAVYNRLLRAAAFCVVEVKV